MTKPPEVKSSVIRRIWQKIKSENIFETDLDFEPKYVPWVYMENVIQRTLSRMVGQGPYGPVTVKCTKEGNLAVVTRGGAFDDYQELEFAYSSANEEHEFVFSQQVERIDLFTYDGKVDYQLTRDLVKPYGQKIELFEDSFYSLDFYTKRVKATCKTFSPKAEGTSTSTSANHLVDSGASFQTDGVKTGNVVSNITDNTYAAVTAVNSETDLTLSEDIFVAGEDYTIEGTRTKLMGWFRAEE